jgi:hypothetical protein
VSLFDPAAHEHPVEASWDPVAMRAAIAAIVEETENAYDDGWPGHPLDDLDFARRYRTIYLGGAGVIRVLHDLQDRGLAELRHDYAGYLDRPYEPEFPQYDHAHSLLMGEPGLRLVRHRVAPSAENLDRLAGLIDSNHDNPSRELLWGSPGTMLAAAALGADTGERRWDELWSRSAAALDAAREADSGVWLHDLYGNQDRYLGPGHGFAGCVVALTARPGFEHIEPHAARIARRYAIEEDGAANWPPVAGGPLRSRPDSPIRVQWCHGAPGMVISLAPLAASDAEHDRLMRAGGELTWRAGPLAKGAGLCHGTAGNGYAFLALLRRTGNELWLMRARAFAMHAAAQVDRDRAVHGRRRFSMWTGDLGVALYLADCLRGDGAFPLP